MPTGNPTHLLNLANRAFRELTETRPTPAPAHKPKSFKPIRLNPAKLDESWDKKRGAALRLTAVLLHEDDAGLRQRVCESDRTVKTYTAAADWLQRESLYLRKIARFMDTASGRLSVTLGRCDQSNQAP